MDIPGVGVRLRDRLVEHYGSEEKCLDAILKGDVADLLNVISERQAVTLAQWATGLSYGVKPTDFLATEESMQIYRKLIARISSYAHTDYARRKIETLFPASSMEFILENRTLAESAIQYAEKLDGSGVEELLTKIKPIRKRSAFRIRNRALVVDSTGDLTKMKARGIDKLIDLHLAESAGELKDIATGYDHVCVIGNRSDYPLTEVEYAESLEDWYLVPEAVLSHYTENLDSLGPAMKAARLLYSSGIDGFEGLDDLERMMDILLEGDDDEAQRLAQLLDQLDNCIEQSVGWANNELAHKIGKSSLTLEGMDILQALDGEKGVREIFESQMRDVFHDVLDEAKSQVKAKLKLTGVEEIYLEEIFTAEIRYPLEINRKASLQFGQELRTRLEARRLKMRRDLARKLEDKKDVVQSVVSHLLEFDVAFSVGRFALSEGLSMPLFIDSSSLGFLDGRNLFIENADPVSYSLGKTGMTEYDEGVVLLSGVNSGGKTSLLELIAQIVILAHMGMPVPAKSCKTCLFEELYFFGKSKGTLSAGAFETAMRKFSVVENDMIKLILADELEAITEPGASAKIIACMLDELSRKDSVAVFVSHLAEEVERFVETRVRVDGIEAEGLDAENNLIVRRSPRYNHLAKSTPELILDRLVRTTIGSEQEFYARLLRKFN
jgi:DNA mismatch repair protein MutS2